jgi:hypothetical protein
MNFPLVSGISTLDGAIFHCIAAFVDEKTVPHRAPPWRIERWDAFGKSSRLRDRRARRPKIDHLDDSPAVSP